MSQPKRYRGLTHEEKLVGGAKPPFPADLMIDPEGNLVAYSDYALLRQQFSNLAEERYETIAALEAKVAALAAENERLKSRLSMSQAIAEACGEPQGDGAITVKTATSTGKTVLTDIAAKEGRDAK